MLELRGTNPKGSSTTSPHPLLSSQEVVKDVLLEIMFPQKSIERDEEGGSLHPCNLCMTSYRVSSGVPAQPPKSSGSGGGRKWPDKGLTEGGVGGKRRGGKIPFNAIN